MRNNDFLGFQGAPPNRNKQINKQTKPEFQIQPNCLFFVLFFVLLCLRQGSATQLNLALKNCLILNFYTALFAQSPHKLNPMSSFNPTSKFPLIPHSSLCSYHHKKKRTTFSSVHTFSIFFLLGNNHSYFECCIFSKKL